MTLTIELTMEQQERLNAEAQARGTDAEAVLRDLVETLPARSTIPKSWGARVLEEWRAAGVIGPYGDPSQDSPETARALRERLESELFPSESDAA